MNILEKTLEDIIYFSDPEILRQHGLSLLEDSIVLRQMKIGNYGIADLVYIATTDQSVSVQILELKQGKIDNNAFFQGIRYCRGIQRILDGQGLPYDIHLTLVGQQIVQSDLAFLPSLCNDKSLSFFEYKVSLEGISFHSVKTALLIDEALDGCSLHNHLSTVNKPKKSDG